ncbi:MAG: S8 family serine peptidase, partial [Pseudomonadota bacterium]
MRRVLSTGAMVSVMALTLSATVPAFGQNIAQSVLDRAQEQDTVRVIVRLNTPFDAQSMALEGEGGPQRQAIAAAQSSFAASLQGVELVDPLEGLPLTVLEVTAEQLDQLRGNDAVLSVVEDELAEPTMAQTVPLIEADKAHDRNVKGQGQIVAVLDTGVDTGHTAFSGKIVSQACYSSTSGANNSTSLCPGGVSETTANGSGDDCSSGISGCGHGTHVAGTVAGNGGGVLGVAPQAKLVAIQVFSRFSQQSSCGSAPAPCVRSYTSDQIKGLNRVRQLAQGGMKIASVNMSLGGGQHTSHCDSDSRKTVIDQLRALKVATVIASGNDGWTGSVGAPSCISSAISVGSTTKSDGVSGFSNHATLVDMLAPGSSITSARNGGGTTPKSGTSMATPHVAGAWALHKSKHPNDSVTTVENKLESEGKSITHDGITKPRIDLGYLGQLVFVPVQPAKSPLAFGTIWSNGSKQASYGSWTSSFNAGSMRYEITITGQNYHYLRYATVVTPMDRRFCKSSSVSGKLLVYCYD